MKFKLSLRLPPTFNPKKASEIMTELLTKNPPFGATVTFTDIGYGSGWNAPSYKPWLKDALNKAS